MAETVLTDQSTNSVSAINLIEEVHAQGYPLLIPRLSVLAMNVRNEDDETAVVGQLRVTLNGEELYSTEVDVNFQDALRNRTTITFGGLVLPAVGIMRVVFELAGGRVESPPIPIAGPAEMPPPEVTIQGDDPGP